jgi:hypothetical protein
MSRECQKQPLNDGTHPYTTFGIASFEALQQIAFLFPRFNFEVWL